MGFVEPIRWFLCRMADQSRTKSPAGDLLSNAHHGTDDPVVVDSLKALDPEWPIREADMAQAS